MLIQKSLKKHRPRLNGNTGLAFIIKNLRRKHNLTQADMASRLRVTQSTIAHIERGANHRMRLDTMLLLAERFGVPFQTLISNHRVRMQDEVKRENEQLQATVQQLKKQIRLLEKIIALHGKK